MKANLFASNEIIGSSGIFIYLCRSQWLKLVDRELTIIT
jgi:hypothetical protein